LGGQHALHRKSIPHNAKILWLYTSKKTFGDANLELSGRKLLKDRGISIDVLVCPEVYPLFKEDDIFEHVFTNLNEIDRSQYTHIILSEYNYKSIKLKIKHFKNVPYSCLFGYFDGPARNQFYFSYFAINDYFSLKLSPENIIELARPYISSHTTLPYTLRQSLLTHPLIAIGVGGIDPGRTYQNWPELVNLLDDELSQKGNKKLNIALLGAPDAHESADRIASIPLKNITVISLVGKTNILESYQVLKKAGIYLGCDGGLLHIAHAAECFTISIFREHDYSAFYVPGNMHCVSFVAGSNANNIPAGTMLPPLLKHLFIETF